MTPDPLDGIGPAAADLIEEFLEEASSGGRPWAGRTVATGRSVLRRYARWATGRQLALRDATRADLRAYMSQGEAEGRSAASRQMDRRMLRALYRWLVAEGELGRDARDPAAGLKPVLVPEPPVHHVSEDEYRKVRATCDRSTLLGRRDEAVVVLMYTSGLRRGEIAGLDLEGVDLEGHLDPEGHRPSLLVGSATFTTKNRRPRRVGISAEAAATLRRYLRRRGREPGALFLSRFGERLSPDAIGYIVLRRRADAGLPHLTAHQFRRAFAINWLAKGGTEIGLMRQGGWTDQQMVARYTRSAADKLAADEFHRLDDDAPRRKRRARDLRAV